jgi:hypothetical protein
MLSFALFGGMLVNTKQMNGAGDRVVSHPSNFVPITTLFAEKGLPLGVRQI